MRDSAIRHLAACDDSSRIAAALFESTVQIWDWDKARQIGEFETILDFGGQRLALAAGGSICITGSWTDGLAAYSVPSGDGIWQRPDLTRVQLLTLGASGQEINCGFDTSPLAVIDVNTGDVLKTLPDTRRIFASRFCRCDFVEENEQYRIVGAYTSAIPSTSFALHDAALSPEAVCIAESGIRCIELESGRQVWHHPSLGANRLAFCAADYNFYCLAVTNRPPHHCSLVRLAPNLIDCDQVAFIGPCSEAAFSQSGNVLVTMRGTLYETSTGHLLKQLDFPQCDYPDR